MRPPEMPARDQIILRDFGATRAEREIIFARAALVGMAFDREGVAAILLQPARLLVERGLRGRVQFRRVGFEEDAVADVDDEILRAARRGIASPAATAAARA